MISIFLLGVYVGAMGVIVVLCVVGMIREFRGKREPAIDVTAALMHELACEGAALLRERAS